MRTTAIFDDATGTYKDVKDMERPWTLADHGPVEHVVTLADPGPAEHVVILARIEALERQVRRLTETPNEQRSTIERLESALIHECERADRLEDAQDRESQRAMQSWGYARDAIDAINSGKTDTALRILRQVRGPLDEYE